VVSAEVAQLILATNLVATSADAPSFAATIQAMEQTLGLPKAVLSDTGFASGPAVEALQARGIDPLWWRSGQPSHTDPMTSGRRPRPRLRDA
jgi:hypothetical protein